MDRTAPLQTDRSRLRRCTGAATALLVLAAGACGPAGDESQQTPDVAGNLVEVTSTGMNIQMPSEIPSGWTTFRYSNQADVVHFVVVEQLPEGRTVEDSRAEVIPVFQDAMNLIMNGDPEAGFAELGNLPEWFGDVVFMGGPGFVAPGRTAQTTVRLEPGTYVVECYVKTPEGIFHSTAGMIAGLTVTAEDGGGTEPEGDVTVVLDAEGMSLDGVPVAGEQTFAVQFEAQAVYGNGLAHDVHLVRLSEEATAESVSAWMNWAAPSGLMTPAPAEFLGGTHEQPAGMTAYFTATLEPGRYALVSEVPDPLEAGLMLTFEVQ